MLAPGGELADHLPVGYNAAFDSALRGGTIPISASAAMGRLGEGRYWRELPPDQVWSAPYDFLLYAARGVFFAWIESEAPSA